MTTGSGELIPDLWWIEPGEKDHLIYVGHHLPISDDDEPLFTRWFHSVRGDRLSESKVRYPAAFLQTWTARCANVNVYRSLQLFPSSDENGATLLGPFLIDIDNSNWNYNTGAYEENLHDALDVARRAVGVLTTRWGVQVDDLRVFFSGRKGFNLEIRPSAVGINGSYHQQLVKSSEMLTSLRGQLKSQGNFSGATVGRHGTVIDPIYGSPGRAELKHPYTRLHGSINRWIGTTRETSRQRLEIQVPDLFTQDIPTMVENSKM